MNTDDKQTLTPLVFFVIVEMSTYVAMYVLVEYSNDTIPFIA